MDANTVIRVTDVSKRFGSFTAVDHASLSVNHGDIFGFIGKNGAGKTTLMRMIAGLMKPTGGTVSISSREDRSGLSSGGSVRIGFLPQNVRFDDNTAATRIIEFFAGLKKTDVSECLAFAEELGLDLEKKAKNMSPGQQRKLQLVIATAGKPEILMLDEPTAGLDPSAAQQLKEIIKKLNAQGCSIFISSHILRELDDFCTRVAVIDKGRIIYEGMCVNAYRLEIGEADGEMLTASGREAGARLKINDSGKLVAYADREVIPELVHSLCARNVRVFEVRPLGLEAVYNELIGGLE